MGMLPTVDLLSASLDLPSHVLWGNGDDQYTKATLKQVDDKLLLFVFSNWDDGQSLEVLAYLDNDWVEEYSLSTEYQNAIDELFPSDLALLIASWPTIPDWKEHDEPEGGVGQAGPGSPGPDQGGLGN